jgi:hypothetical protein
MDILTFVLTFVVGLMLCIGIWVAVPYNNFALNNSFVSDGYLPEIVIFCVAVIVLGVNPLLRRFLPSCRLSHSQLALLVGMLLFAAVLPSNGLLRFFPHCVAYDTAEINKSPILAEEIKNSDLPAALFPDAIAYDSPTPVSDQLVGELDPGESIPWGAWIRPSLAWGAVIVAFWVMMIGLGMTVYPQWRHNERLTFPLLKVYHAMIDEPEEGRLIPTALRSIPFWVGCGLVIVLHSFNGLSLLTEEAFPKFPLSGDVSQAFANGVWEFAPGFLQHPRIYFLFIGLAYFMPSRYSFSIWFTIFFFGLVVMASRQYFPTFNTGSLYDQGAGALIMIALGIVWLGRVHYLRVLRSAFRRASSEDDKTNALAGRLLLGGCAAIFAWFVWAGAGVGWSMLFVIVGVMVMLLVARIVAETGITYVWIIPLTAGGLINLFPRSWVSVSTAFLQSAHYVLANRMSAVSAAVMMVLTLGLNRKASPKGRRNLAGIAIVVLVVGLLVCGAVHLNMGYNMATSYDGLQPTITGRGATRMGLGPVTDLILGRSITDRGAQVGYILWGFALAGVLLLLCTRFPGWPLHPIGLIFVHSSIGLRLCVSLFLGWLLRTVILHYFGARIYRAAMPLFLGFILGEILANALWTLIPVLQIVFGARPGGIQHIVIFNYT